MKGDYKTVITRRAIEKRHDVQINVQSVCSWDAVISSAVNQLSELEAIASRVRVSLEYFERRKASGELFPGREALKDEGLI